MGGVSTSAAMSDDILSILAAQSEAIGRVEASLKLLVGNGQPGLIKEMRDDIDSLKDSRSHMRGYTAGITGAIALFEIAIHYFGKKLGLK